MQQANVPALPEFVEKKISQLVPDERPVLLCDIDGVVLQFTRIFRAFLASRGLTLQVSAEGISASRMYPVGEANPLPTDEGYAISGEFFERYCDDLPPYIGACETLALASDCFVVVLLSNFPERYRVARETNLKRLDLNAPLILSHGEKGDAVRKIVARFGAGSIFIDDQPQQIESAARAEPDCRAVQISLDSGSLPMIRTANGAFAHVYSWSSIRDMIGV